MEYRLTDFLVQLHSLNASSRLNHAKKSLEAEKLFEQYLYSLGIEYFNYGAFQLNQSGIELDRLAGTNMPTAWIEEYFERQFFHDDIVMKKAADIQPDTTNIFRFGGWLSNQLPVDYSSTAQVLAGCGDAGMQDAIGLVGRSKYTTGSAGGRFYAVGMGGKDGTGDLAWRNRDEIQVAIYSLFDVMQPILEAQLDKAETILSHRERELLCGLAAGKQRAELAFDCGISIETVDFHFKRLKKKLRAKTLAECVGKGFRYDLVS